MPKVSVNDLHKATIELDDGLMEMHRRQEDLSKEVADLKTLAIIGLIAGSISLVIILSFIALALS